MEMIQVPPTFVQKVIGLVEANKGMQVKQAAIQADLRAKATEAVTGLTAKGYVESEKAASLINSIVENPGVALEALTKMAANAAHVDEVVSPGKADTVKKAADVKGPSESDRVWNEGFGFQS